VRAQRIIIFQDRIQKSITTLIIGIDSECHEYADDNEKAFGKPASFTDGHGQLIVRKQAAE
jgi:hypothetical protein